MKETETVERVKPMMEIGNEAEKAAGRSPRVKPTKEIGQAEKAAGRSPGNQRKKLQP